MATIQKRIGKNGQETYRVLVRRKGQPLQTRTCTTKTDAKKWAIKIESQINDGKVFKTSPAKQKTVAETIDRYLEHTLPTKGTSSKTNQKKQLEWWKAQVGSMKLSDLTRAVVIEKRDMLAVQNYTRHSAVKKYAPATVDRYLDALSAVLTAAVYEWEWLGTHPLRGYKVKFRKDKPSETAMRKATKALGGSSRPYFPGWSTEQRKAA